MNHFSIIMPCHNGSQYLTESIESVLAQTCSDWELIVVDDGSTDNSVDIVRGFVEKDSRIKLFHTERASGSPTEPRNIGIQHATGRYIAFLDCDDVWLPTKLEKQLPLFEHEKTAVVFSYYEKMTEEGKRNNRIIKSPDKVSYNFLLQGNCIGNLTGVYDTHKVGKVFQKKIRHEDYVMWLSVLKNGWIAENTNSREAVYREQKGSTSGNKFVVFKWTWNIYRNELKFPVWKSLFYFSCYACRAILKFLK